MSKTVLFLKNVSSIQPIDRALSGAITPSQSNAN